MKDKRIFKLKIEAERDLKLSDGAFRLLMRVSSHIYVDPKKNLEKSFPLPWSTVALWCGLKDADACARRILELVDAGYLKLDGLRGCPPINHFFLVPNYRSPAVIDCRSGGVNNSGAGAVNDCRSGGVDHISNSFQEEKIKGKRREIKRSLRSKGTVEGVNGSLCEKQEMTDAERSSRVHALQQLRGKLASKTGTGSF